MPLFSIDRWVKTPIIHHFFNINALMRIWRTDSDSSQKRLQIAFYLLNSWTNKKFSMRSGGGCRRPPFPLLFKSSATTQNLLALSEERSITQSVFYFCFDATVFHASSFFLKGIFVIYGPEKKRLNPGWLDEDHDFYLRWGQLLLPLFWEIFLNGYILIHFRRKKFKHFWKKLSLRKDKDFSRILKICKLLRCICFVDDECDGVCWKVRCCNM